MIHHQPPGLGPAAQASGQAVAATTDTPRTRARRGDDRDGALAARCSQTHSHREGSLYSQRAKSAPVYVGYGTNCYCSLAWGTQCPNVPTIIHVSINLNPRDSAQRLHSHVSGFLYTRLVR